MINTIIAILALLFGQHATVITKTYEGFADYNDLYLVETTNGQIYEVIADDLESGDPVTLFMVGDFIIDTMYDWR